MEGAGTVEAVADDVTDLRPGDRVAYAGTIGGYAEARLIAADRVVKLPETIGDEVAAAMMLQGMDRGVPQPQGLSRSRPATRS